MSKPRFSEKHVPHGENHYRLTWSCDPDTGQCDAVFLVSCAERNALIDADLVYQNADHEDPDHAYSFQDDLHPNWEKVGQGWECVRFVEEFRKRQPYPHNLGPILPWR